MSPRLLALLGVCNGKLSLHRALPGPWVAQITVGLPTMPYGTGTTPKAALVGLEAELERLGHLLPSSRCEHCSNDGTGACAVCEVTP